MSSEQPQCMTALILQVSGALSKDITLLGVLMVVISHWCSVVLSYDLTVKAIAYDSNHDHTHQTIQCPTYEAL